MATENDTLVAETPAANPPPLSTADAPSGRDSTTAGRLELDKLFENANKAAAERTAKEAVAAPKTASEAASEPPKGQDSPPPPENAPQPVLEAKPDKPVVEAPPPVEDATEDDDKAAKAVLENPHATKRQKRPWEKFLSEREAHKATKAERDRLASERVEFERKVAATADYEEQRKARQAAEQEAARYRAVVELEQDPAFVQRYAERETKLNGAVNRALASLGVKEKAYKTQNAEGREVDAVTLEYIANQGGILRFAKTHPENYRQIINMLEERDPVEADALRSAVAGLRDLGSDKDAEIAKIKQSPQAFQEQRKQQAAAQQQAEAQRQERIAQALNNYRDKEYQRHEAFKIAQVPEKATNEERTKIEASNTQAQKYRDELKRFHDGVFGNKFNADELAQGALAAVLYIAERDKANAALARVKELEEENGRLKKAGIVKPAGTTLPPPASARQHATPPAPEPKGEGLAKSVLEIAEANARKRQGQEAGTLN